MAGDQISRHEVLAFGVLEAEATDPARWVTSLELADLATIAPRTARALLLRYTDIGLVERVKVSPGHRYRLADRHTAEAAAHVRKVRQASEAFGNGTAAG